jgi:hypothetical protein
MGKRKGRNASLEKYLQDLLAGANIVTMFLGLGLKIDYTNILLLV